MLTVYKRLIGLYTIYNSKVNFIALMFFLICLSALRVYEPFFVKELVDLMWSWIDQPIDMDALKDILIRRGTYIVLMIVGRFIGLIWYKKKRLNVYNGEYLNIAKTTHDMHFGNYLTQSKSMFSKIIHNGNEATWHLGSQFFREYIYQIVMVLSVVIAMFTVNRRMALLTLFMMPLMLRITVIMDPKTFKMQMDIDNLRDKGYALIGDSMTNMGTVKTFTLEEQRTQAVANNIDLAASKQIPLQWRRTFHDSYMRIILLIARMVVVGGGVWLYTKGLTTIGEIVLYFTFVNFTYYPLMNLLGGLEKTMQQVVAWKKLYDLMDSIKQSGEDITLSDMVGGSITFDAVNFSYVANSQILYDVSFSIPEGKKVALVGHTGSGKSTIAHLLLRFWEVSDGGIYWGSKNINHIGLGTLRKQIGVIMQDTTLFNTTVYNNLVRCMGSGYNDTNDQEKEKILKDVLIKAQAAFVFDLPDGRHTVIGERGLKLSGGEKQRLALARLLLKNPQMVVLDEATSALDNQTELQIKQVIDEVFVDKTMLIIAHRLSTVKKADRVVVLDAGRVVEQGTYDDLMNTEGALWQLANPEDVLIE